MSWKTVFFSENKLRMMRSFFQNVTKYINTDFSFSKMPCQKYLFDSRISLASNFSLGTIYRILILRVVYREGVFRHPINLMTAFDESVKMLTYHWTMFTWGFSIELFDKNPLAHYTGAWFCHLSKVIGTLALCTNITNGIGMK